MCLLAVSGSKAIVVKCAAAILFRTVECVRFPASFGNNSFYKCMKTWSDAAFASCLNGKTIKVNFILTYADVQVQILIEIALENYEQPLIKVA